MYLNLPYENADEFKKKWNGQCMIYNEFKKMERHSKKGIITFKAGKRPKHENEDPIRSGIDGNL